MQNSEGEQILAKKYQLIKKIGSGSFGYIYSCTFFHIQANPSSQINLLLPK